MLVYLHGGPGDAVLPLVMKYNKMLEQQFTVVVWEQRGAGKSYYKFDGAMTIAVFLDDLHSLVDLLPPWFYQRHILTGLKRRSSSIGLRNPAIFHNGARVNGSIGCCVICLLNQSAIALCGIVTAAAGENGPDMR